MLSRIAEALFWTGRYVERAAGTARILDVHLQLMLEDPQVDEATACRGLLAVMGTYKPEQQESRQTVIQQLAMDPENPASIAHSVSAARENARRAREIISTDLWEILNYTNSHMPQRLPIGHSHHFFAWIRDRSALAFGVVESSMSRDEAWQFFSLGRALERADMTARLLSTRTLTDAGGPSWTTILRSSGAYEAYLRSERSTPTDLTAVQFLLVDRLFPRSVLASFLTAEACLQLIEPTGGRPSAASPQNIIGRARSELEYRPVELTAAALPESMENVQIAVSDASEAIQKRYFPSLAMPVWTGENG